MRERDRYLLLRPTRQIRATAELLKRCDLPNAARVLEEATADIEKQVERMWNRPPHISKVKDDATNETPPKE